MSDQSTKVLSYWRAALADSQLGKGAFSASQVRGLNGRGITLDQLRSQNIETDDAWLASANDQAVTVSCNDINAWFQGHDNDWVRCVVYPFIFLRANTHQHGVKIRSLAPEMFAPVSFTVLINKRGEIISHGRPGVARELLEPSHIGQPLILGSVKELDDFFDREDFPDWLDEQEPDISGRWALSDVLEYCEKILDEVVTVSLNEPLIEDTEARYSLMQQGLIHKAQQISVAVRPLIETYDAARDAKKLNRVFHTVATGRALVNAQESSQTRTASFERGRELGDDQKQAIERALSLPEGDAMSVSGPPGTGKTIILQDLVANLLVDAALDSREPPLIVVASTNNQAVTNVLDSFGRVNYTEFGALGQRWIEVPDSLGVFIASHQRTASARNEGYLIPAQIEEYESSLDIGQQEQLYLGHAVSSLSGIGTDQDLLSVTRSIQEVMRDIRNVIRALGKLTTDFQSLKGDSSFRKYRHHLSRLNKKAIRYGGRSLTAGIPEMQDLIGLLNEYDQVNRRYSNSISAIKDERRRYNDIIATLPVWAIKLRNCPGFNVLYSRHIEKRFDGNVPTAQVTERRIRQCQAERQSAIRSIQTAESIQRLQIGIEAFVERFLRPTLFMLALRYFEGCWLAEMKATLRAGDTDKRSYTKSERKWRRRSKLHPCMVSTLHSLPRHLTYWDHLIGQELPAFNFLDWLIVDEAGQVSVDVAGPSLLLTKRLMAVGDENQIEPVWSVSQQVDVGNLASTGLLDPKEDVEQQLSKLNKKGITASKGNLITAVKASEPISMMLTGHRRCVPDIIRFCNDLCYQGQLKSLRPGKCGDIPAVGYWYVPGVCERAGGSRRNPIEAAAIASLIADHETEWTGEYDEKPLDEVIAVVTPFRQQAVTIKKALIAALGPNAETITVGTIHSLQGAQRPIILFSPTYSAHQANSIFFDDAPNMLNVAVSRAQDHFFVVGDLDVLRGSAGPANALFRHINAVGHPYSGRLDSKGILTALEKHWGDAPEKVLNGCSEHDVYLTSLLQRSDISELMIFTPVITPDSLRAHGQELLQQVQKGTRIEIVTCRQYNYGSEWSDMFAQGCQLLQSKGVVVRIIDWLSHGALFVDKGREWHITDGSWLGLDETGAFTTQSGCLTEPQSICLKADNLATEHQRYRIGVGLEFAEKFNSHVA